MFHLVLVNFLFSDLAWAHVYIGCFIDQNPRDLSDSETWDTSMTVEKCNDFCRPSFLYFALQVFRSQNRVKFQMCFLALSHSN